MTTIPCYRCADDTNEDKPDGTVCETCNGWGTVTPGTPLKGARKLLKEFVRSEWWKRLRLAEKTGHKRGRKRDRDAKIAKQVSELWAEFLKLPQPEMETQTRAFQVVADANWAAAKKVSAE